MDRPLKLWDELGHMNRSESILTANTNPVKSNNRYKNIILLKARDNYVIAAQHYVNYEWSSFKLKSTKRDISTIKQNTNVNPQIDLHSPFYDYTYIDPMTKPNEGHIWVSFAAKDVGGGYIDTGWVQEEIITAEFYEMALGISKYKALGLNLMNLDEVIIWFNLVRGSEALLGKYGGRHIRNEIVGSFNVENYIIPTKIYPVADFLSIDAPRRSNPSARYMLSEIQHLFIKCLIGFETCVAFERKIIHTGKWGAGAFGNTFAVVFWVQVLIAKLAGVPKINFWGYENVSPKDETLIASFLNVFNTSNGVSFERLYETTKGIFGITFTLEEIFFPLLNLKWGWMSDDKQFHLYNIDIQEVLNTNNFANLNIDNEHYVVSYNQVDGWNQINTRTGTKRAVQYFL